MEKIYKICFLGYKKLSEMAAPVIESLRFDDTEILLRDCNVETLPAVVDRAVAEDCDIFVAGSANAAAFTRYSHKHLVEIQLNTVDYLLAIKKALQLGEHPAIAVYSFSRDINLPLLEELSGTKLDLIEYEDSADLYEKIRASHCDVIIGASHASQIADELGKNSVLLYFGESSIRSALTKARTLAIGLQKETRNDRIISSIISQSPFGLIVSDEQGRIILINGAAKQQTGLTDVMARGKLLSDVIPALSPDQVQAGELRHLDRRLLINDAYIRCSQTRIDHDQNVIGVLTTLYTDNSRRRKKEKSAGEDFVARWRWEDMISNSPSMQHTIRQAKRFADLSDPLVIRGESGCGKEFFAECIHNGSIRAREPFVSINAASIPDQDAMRIFFGNEDVAQPRPGLLELAQGGTVLLQNFSDASPVVKSCIVQVLKEHRFLRCGGSVYVPFRARIITTLSIAADQYAYAIREDAGSAAAIGGNLPEQLSVFALDVPPLRQRPGDIVPFFWELLSRESNSLRLKSLGSLSTLLTYYSWPGNGAEVAAVCKRYAFLLQQTARPTAAARWNLLIDAIGEDKLFQEILRRHPALTSREDADSAGFAEGIAELKQILRYSNTQIGEKLSLSRTTLWRMTR